MAKSQGNCWKTEREALTVVGDREDTSTDGCQGLTVTLTVEVPLWESRNSDGKEARNGYVGR